MTSSRRDGLPEKDRVAAVETKSYAAIVESCEMARISARHRFARIAATKVRPFADLIRGKPAGDGLLLLRFEPNRGARMLEKVLKSAIANCEDRGARNVESLKIVEAAVDGGPMFKRMLPRSRGMANVIRRRFAHIRVVIDVPELA